MIARKSYLDRIETAFRLVPIVVLIGARQVGKTSIMDTRFVPGILLDRIG